MRDILTISLPPGKMNAIKKAAKKAKKSVSAYLIQLFDDHQNLITEDELVARMEEADKNYREGKTKVLSSLRELMEKETEVKDK